VEVFNDAFPGGIIATTRVEVIERPVYYVDLASVSPIFPYATWEEAAATIQDAIDAGTAAGRLVLVKDGIYGAGGVTVEGSMTNRIALWNGAHVRSVNGPDRAWLVGGGDLGDTAIRCAYLSEGAVLSGFTLTNGHTRTLGHSSREQGGGGAWCESSGVLSNCFITGNAAFRDGGGVNGGVLHGCILRGNNAGDDGGGADDSRLYDSLVEANSASDSGGGTDESVLYRCQIRGNSSGANGGGVDDGTLFDCLLTGNRSLIGAGGGASDSELHRSEIKDNDAISGGGLADCQSEKCLIAGNRALTAGGNAVGRLLHCTIVANTATNDAGGTYGGVLDNCVIYDNFLLSDLGTTNYIDNPFLQWAINHCCTTPAPSQGVGNIEAPPLFLGGGNYRLQGASPCIDAGGAIPSDVTMDLDGILRPLDADGDAVATADMGAYEFNPLRFIQVRRTGNVVRLCWERIIPGTFLERTSSLNPPDWSEVMEVGETNGVELPVEAGREFYRLNLLKGAP